MRKRAFWLWPGVASTVLVSVLCSGRAGAVDGVIEINQTAVFAGGITPGDMPGFPATLSQPGSYRLTGNLDVTKMQNGNPQPGSENIGAILVAADNLTIDLNGFSILGPCSGFPLPCAPTGSGSGIFTNAVYRNATITNGTIQGMGRDGITLDDDPFAVVSARVERVTVDRNGRHGMVLSSQSIVNACIAQGNGSNGFSMSFGGMGTTFNGNTSAGNVGDGIQGGLGFILIIGNMASNNQGFGLDILIGSGYANNAMIGNTSGAVNGGLNLGQNMCNGMLCP